MFLLFGAPPYVSVALGHMFLLCGLKTYVSIFSVKTICFHRLAPPLPITGKELVKYIKLRVNDPYKVATQRLVIDSLAVGITKFEIIVRRSGYLVGSRTIPMEPSTGHVIKYYKYGFTWKLTDYIRRLCICPYMYAFC